MNKLFSQKKAMLSVILAFKSTSKKTKKRKNLNKKSF